MGIVYVRQRLAVLLSIHEPRAVHQFVEIVFSGRKGNEDLALLSIILNQEVRRLSTQVITTPRIRIDQWKSIKLK